MNKAFFPSSKRFWALHLGCWGCLYGFIVFVQILSDKDGVRMQIYGGLIYVFAGVFGGLIYRFLFYALAWHRYSIARVTTVSLAYVLVEAVLIGLLIVAYVYVLSLLAPGWLAALPESLPHENFFLLVFIGNAVNIAILQSMWSAIYIAIATYRRSIKREVESLKLENSLKEAQLNNLSSQLNPHFLFNALNNIRFMMRKNVPAAEDMLTHLSDLLRYALESSDSQKVSLGQELGIVEHYLSLAKIQFNERLRYRQSCDAVLNSALVPPLVLQMLIENGIKHGMDTLKDGGELTLRISRQETRLLVVVSNSFAEKAPKQSRVGGLGIGLANIQKRLELIYAGKATLSSQAKGGCWEAVLSLPFEESEDGRAHVNE